MTPWNSQKGSSQAGRCAIFPLPIRSRNFKSAPPSVALDPRSPALPGCLLPHFTSLSDVLSLLIPKWPSWRPFALLRTQFTF